MVNEKPAIHAALEKQEVRIKLYANDLRICPIFWHGKGTAADFCCYLGLGLAYLDKALE